MSMTEAASRSGNSRQWWLEAEKGVRPPRPEKLARALAGVGAGLQEVMDVFALAGYDPVPFADEFASRPIVTPQATNDEVLAQLLVVVSSLNEKLDAVLERLEGPEPGRAAPVSQRASGARRGGVAS